MKTCIAIQIITAVWLCLLFSSCETAPIQVESAKATVVQNEVTKKHIKTFTDTNRKTQVHIKKVQDEAIEEAKALDTAKRYLDELLGPGQ